MRIRQSLPQSHTTDRDTGPLEGKAVGSWSLGIVEQPQGEGCCWLQRDGLIGCEGGDRVGNACAGTPGTMEAREYCWVNRGGWSHHHSLSLCIQQHRQMNNREAGPSSAWLTVLQSRTPPRGPLYMPVAPNSRELPQAREPSKCLKKSGAMERVVKEASWLPATRC